MAKKNKMPVYLLVVVIFLAAFIITYAYDLSVQKSINSYEDCVKAGYPVLESFPEQCRTPDGRSFTNTAAQFCGTSTFGSCETNADCVTDGCSSQVCRSESEEPVITTCEARACYDSQLYGLGCSCVNNKCQWSR